MSFAYIVCYAWYFVCPNLFLLEWMVWKTSGKEVLEEAHVLQAEEWNLIVRLLNISAYSAAAEGLGSPTWCVIRGMEGYPHRRPVLMQLPQAGRVS